MFGSDNSKRISIVSGYRTPFVSSGTVFREFSSLDLGKIITVELVNRSEIDHREIDQIIFGNVIPTIKSPNLSREISLRAGLPSSVNASTVSQACLSFFGAITTAANNIYCGDSEVIIVGGTESISNMPVLFSSGLRDALFDSIKAKNSLKKASSFLNLTLKDLKPDIPEIAEFSTGKPLGFDAEKIARAGHISREKQDEYSQRSHDLASQFIINNKYTDEIIKVFLPPDFAESVYYDTGVRTDSNLEGLSELKPIFDKNYGTVTAGNSSTLADGAAAMLIMSQEKANSLGYDPLGHIRSYAFSGISPLDMLLSGPDYSTPIALKRAGLSIEDIDLIEIHEAFASQAISNLRTLSSHLAGKTGANDIEEIITKVNVNGGSIAIGHPFSATGGRLVIGLLNEMKRMDKEFGLVISCAAGGLGFSMVLERN